MLEAIKDCEKRCNKHNENFTKKLGAIPDIVFHYTDCTGLLGILKSGGIRLTDIFSLNDPSEVRHGVNLAVEILNTETQRGNPAASKFANKFKNYSETGVEVAAHFFVACFSDTHKDLGQWRAYGDDGKGFTIGFDGKLLEGTFVKRDNETVPGNGTFPITYNDNRLIEIYKQIVNEVLPLFAMTEGRNLSDAIINEFEKYLSIVATISILYAAVLFKHIAYKNEKEYRFLQIRAVNESDDNLGYRARLNSLVRFSEFDWNTTDQQVLREIVIGPAADENSAKVFAQECLRASGIDPDRVKIHKSKIPYRNI